MTNAPPKDRKPKRPRSRGWRIFFSVFKWFRVSILLLILSVILAVLFLHSAGLPVSAQKRITAQLRGYGWDVQFSKLRLRWYRGIVAEDLVLSRADTMDGPNLFVETAEFRLNSQALRHLNLQANSVLLSGARLIWPVVSTNHPRQAFVLDHVGGELFFHPDDRWELRSLRARALGANIHLRGDLTNAALVRDWKLPRREGPKVPGRERDFWSEFFARARQVRAVVPPEINVVFAADARDPRTLDATVKLIAPGLESEWGAVTNLSLIGRLHPAPVTNAPMRAELKITADAPRTPWAEATNLVLEARWEPSLERWVPTNSRVQLQLSALGTPWGGADHLTVDATNAAAADGEVETTFHLSAKRPALEHFFADHIQFTARALHPPTNPLPARIRGGAELVRTLTPWATSGSARVEATLSLPAKGQWRVSDTNAPWPDRVQNISTDFTLALSNVLAPHLEFSRIAITNRWHGPDLHLQASADSDAGNLELDGKLNTETRAANLSTRYRGDPHQLARLLPTNALPWLDGYQSRLPLEAQVAASATLPALTNAPGWRSNLLATLIAGGRFESGAGSFRGVAFTNAVASLLAQENEWKLDFLRVHRTEGSLTGDAQADPRTGEFSGRLSSSMDLHGLRPLFPQRLHRHLFDPFQFTQPPVVIANVRGNWHDWESISASGAASVTNAAIRTQAIAYAAARLELTNRFLSFFHPVLLRPGERADGDGVGLDLRTKRLYLTNCHGNLAPMALAQAIGPHVVRALRPYVFDTPPQSRVSGLLPLAKGDDGEDARFELEGGPFHWWRFHADRVRGTVLWQGKTVTITDLSARWRGSDALGWVRLDFAQPKGGTLAFHMAVEGAELSDLLRDMQEGKTNRLEGIVGGEVTITHAFLNDPKSWQGHGQVHLTEGLLWDIPLFAVLSPMLNKIIPGLGHSRAREGRAAYTITNSVIHSRDVQIRASAMELKYRGTVDFEGRLDATMEAELFRNVPGIGVILSKVLWPVTKLFEYRITGTLAEPRLDEKYFIPKVVLFPLQPVKTLKDLFDQDKEKEKPAPRPGSPP